MGIHVIEPGGYRHGHDRRSDRNHHAKDLREDELMPIPTVYRHAYHSDHEHEARENGFNAGWDHANFVDAYGQTTDTEMPDRFKDVPDVWQEAYGDGKAEFENAQNDEEMYGHDWHGWKEGQNDV